MADTKKGYEAQLVAMKVVMEALEPLDEEAREAVLSWVDGQRQGSGKSRTPQHASRSLHTPAREGTVSVVAQKIGAKSARDLLLAAAVHLTLFQGKDKFSKAEIVACAKEARAWKSNYSNQIALNIKRMSDAGVLFEKSKDVFSLSDSAVAEVEAKLAR